MARYKLGGMNNIVDEHNDFCDPNERVFQSSSLIGYITLPDLSVPAAQSRENECSASVQEQGLRNDLCKKVRLECHIR
ncbi:hypothetical protein J6590_006685 [Homalodisca vitripennis]|nr:hypothetical protein J6590_006685 [Homalodisca vitripennis]